MRMRSSDSPVALCALYSLQPGATDSVHFVVQGTALRYLHRTLAPPWRGLPPPANPRRCGQTDGLRSSQCWPTDRHEQTESALHGQMQACNAPLTGRQHTGASTVRRYDLPSSAASSLAALAAKADAIAAQAIAPLARLHADADLKPRTAGHKAERALAHYGATARSAAAAEAQAADAARKPVAVGAPTRYKGERLRRS